MIYTLLPPYVVLSVCLPAVTVFVFPELQFLGKLDLVTINTKILTLSSPESESSQITSLTAAYLLTSKSA